MRKAGNVQRSFTAFRMTYGDSERKCKKKQKKSETGRASPSPTEYDALPPFGMEVHKKLVILNRAAVKDH